MKPWMRALVWLGLGGGIGFFSGYRIGAHVKEEELDGLNERLDNAEKRNDLIEHNYAVQNEYSENSSESEILRLKEELRTAKEALSAFREYKGEDTEDLPFETPEKEEEDPEMPEVPEMPDDLESEDNGDTDGDEEIQPFHPEDLRPFGISSSEYIRNEKGYDKVQLDFYTEDGVIFDPEREERWTHPEQLLGIGWRARFISNDERVPVREAYIQNDTMGTLYKITRIDDSFERLYEEE